MNFRTIPLKFAGLLVLAVFATVLISAQGTDPLAGTQWILVSYGTPGSETQTLTDSTVTLEFGSDQQAGGNGGCNTYGSSYTVDGSSLTFAGVASTLMACADNAVMNQELVYFQALQTVTGYELADHHLTLLYGDGQQLNFTQTGAPDSTLDNSQWRLVSTGTGDTRMPVVEGSAVTLVFGIDNQVTGSGGCNTYTGGYAADGERLTFDGVVSTKMACADDHIGMQEQQYFQALQAASRYTLSGDQLIISADDGSQLVFERAVVLDNTRWQLQSMSDGATVSSALAGTPITLAFAAENQVTGSGGCNTYSGTYTLTERSITISEILSTRKACADETVMTQEQAFFNALTTATGYIVTPDTLTIQYGDGQELNFIRASSLASSQWQLQSYGAEGQEIPVMESSRPTLEFGAENTVSGSGGCNSFGGNYTVQDAIITFDALVSTEMACVPEAVNAQEQAYLAALLAARYYEITNDHLVIEYGDGQRLIFIRAASTASSQ